MSNSQDGSTKEDPEEAAAYDPFEAVESIAESERKAAQEKQEREQQENEKKEEILRLQTKYHLRDLDFLHPRYDGAQVWVVPQVKVVFVLRLEQVDYVFVVNFDERGRDFEVVLIVLCKLLEEILTITQGIPPNRFRSCL